MGSHIIDSVVLGGAFTAPEVAALFSDEQRVQRWLDIEAALAEAQAEIGMIPEAAAKEISSQARVELLDIEALGRDIAEAGHPIVPFLRAFQEICDPSAGEYLHYGTTTQDIIDTGMMLQVRDAFAILRDDLVDIRANLADQARRYRDTVMVGRTHGQQGLPITFGYKIAVWVDEIDRHLARIEEARERVFVGNVTGAVGTMASFGSDGFEVQRRTLEKLDLGVPAICWHSSRDRIAELAMLLVQMTGTMGKVANEIYNLQRTEIDEVREPFHHGKVGSSTMPHKQNPSVCEVVYAVARLVRGNLIPLTDTLYSEHERDAACLRLEWAAMPEAVIYSAAVLRQMKVVSADFRPRPEMMARNVELLGGLLLSERVMLALGDRIGKQTAHEVVYEIAMGSMEKGIPFRESLAEDSRITEAMDADQVEALLDPAAYIGLAPEIVDRVLAGPDG